MINRRHFMQHSALAALGAFALPATSFARPADASTTAVPTFVEAQYAEDVIWLSQLLDLPEAMRQALYANRQYFQLGMSNTAERFAKEAMDLIYQNWNDPQQRDTAHTQFAYLLGGYLRPAFAATGTDYTEAAIYRDACLLKSLYNARPDNRPLTLDRPINDVTEAEVFALFEAMAQRNQIRLHTFRPDFEDVEGWMDHLLSWTKQSRERHRALAAVYVRPEPTLVEQYWNTFYDNDDAIIRALRAAQNSGPATPMLLTGNSAYGKALVSAAAQLTETATNLE